MSSSSRRCAFNLLLGYTGLVSFGHAAYLATDAYTTGWLVRSEGWAPELGVLAGVAAPQSENSAASLARTPVPELGAAVVRALVERGGWPANRSRS